MSSASDERELIALRDRLLDELDEQGVRGVITAGIGRANGKPALVVLVTPEFAGGCPSDFHGTAVVTREMKPAIA